MNRRNVLKGVAVGAGLLTVTGAGAAEFANQSSTPMKIPSSSVSLTLSESTATSESERNSFVRYITDKYPSNLLRGCGEDMTGRLSDETSSDEFGLQTKQLQLTGNTWSKRDISVGENGELISADCRVVEYEYVDNPVSGEDHLHYRFWLATKPSTSDSVTGHLYNFWPSFSVSDPDFVEDFAPRNLEPRESRIPVQLRWNRPSEGGLQYAFPLTKGNGQIHPERTTLTKAFTPQWLGDSTAPQIVSGAVQVSRPHGADRNCNLRCFVAGNKYPKFI